MENEFEHRFRDIETKAPKDLVREYETPEGSKVRSTAHSYTVIR